MPEEQSTTQLLLELEALRREVATLRQEKVDLQVVLETTAVHTDAIQAQLHQANQQLQAEVQERQRAEAALQVSQLELQNLLELVQRDKADLEILLETMTEHSDAVEAQLHDRAEAAVRESERRLAQFLDALPVGVFVVNAQGQPYYANRIAKQLLGQGINPGVQVENFPTTYQAYLAGTTQFYPPERQPIFCALQGDSTTVDDLELHLDGRVVPLEVWASPIFDQAGGIEYAIAAFQDITDRKRADAERQAFTERLCQVNQAYERFVPRQFLQLLDKESIVEVQLGDQVRKEMAVLFADIRNFTSLSERLTPEENFRFINSYLSRMEPLIVQNHGFVDKYIGDAIMALFSAGADDAVQAGIAMLNELQVYNRHRASIGYVPINVGIGINTGSLMLGTVGGSQRMNGTVISDAVNIAARVEGLTKDYKVPLLITHQTFWRLQDATRYAIRWIDRVRVKGKSDDIAIFEVFDGDSEPIKEGKLATLSQFEAAMILYSQNQYVEAGKILAECLRLNPGDQVARIYWERCQAQRSHR
jgi:class 3 adenylate cyclase